MLLSRLVVFHLSSILLDRFVLVRRRLDQAGAALCPKRQPFQPLLPPHVVHIVQRLQVCQEGRITSLLPTRGRRHVELLNHYFEQRPCPTLVATDRGMDMVQKPLVSSDGVSRQLREKLLRIEEGNSIVVRYLSHNLRMGDRIRSGQISSSFAWVSLILALSYISLLR